MKILYTLCLIISLLSTCAYSDYIVTLPKLSKDADEIHQYFKDLQAYINFRDDCKRLADLNGGQAQLYYDQLPCPGNLFVQNYQTQRDPNENWKEWLAYTRDMATLRKYERINGEW